MSDKRPWIVRLTPEMISDLEWQERVMKPTADEIDALAACFDAMAHVKGHALTEDGGCRVCDECDGDAAHTGAHNCGHGAP